MELSTKIPIPKSNHPIDYNSRIVSFGSCFADEVGKKFEHFKFNHLTNPFGILFHPLAIENVIDFALSEKKFAQDDIFLLDERWHCFDTHSAMSHPNKNVMLANLNDTLNVTRQNTIEATHFIITLGTAWVYNHLESNEIVANCHKVPQKAFKKKLLSIDDIARSIENIVAKVKAVNPNIHFIFTTSPVRHLKDGFTENQLSKSHLIAGLNQFLDYKNSTPLGAGAVEYFPSYEIMMDELRDYRFYAEDMAHPNQLAINFIWERFSETYFTKETFATLKEVDAVQNGLAHKPFNPRSEGHTQFLKKLENQIEKLQAKYSHICF